jgi:hypothetical protein
MEKQYKYIRKNIKYLKLSPWNNFEYEDKTTKNFIKKYKLVSLKSIKKKLRKIAPAKLIDWHKRRFLRRYK